MQPVAVYRRTVRASVERIWENVLDWEHLPWLHSSSFSGIELLESSGAGWRAWVTLPPRQKQRRALIDVRLHRSELFYWTRTVEGAGAGTDIRTRLEPAGDLATDIAVEFFVPGVGPERAREVGEAYTRLYAQLWDEDESMMSRRQQLLEPRHGGCNAATSLRLGSRDELRARLPLTLDLAGRAVRLLELDGAIVAYHAVCPHRGGPLEAGELSDGVVTCPWHGYRFDVRTGACADGRRLHLAAAPRLEVDADGTVRIWSAAPGAALNAENGVVGRTRDQG